MKYDNFIENNNHIFTPNQDDLGKRIDKYLSDNIQAVSRSKIKMMIESGSLYVNDKIISHCSYTIKIDDVINFKIKPSPSTDIIPKSAPINIIYEDDYIIVIDKQKGVTVHPGAGNHDDTLVNHLVAYCGSKLSSVGGINRPGIVHRLDKDTSGLIVVAKDDFAHMELSRQLSNRELKRVYYALVFGKPNLNSGIIKTNIARSRRDRLKMIVVNGSGKLAITMYKLITNYSDTISEIECNLATGRTHQIRVHMDYIGHSIVGDQTYGTNKVKNISNINQNAANLILNFNRQALHSKKLGLIHPRTKIYMEWESPIPCDIKSIIDAI
ncbi:MAG: RluA family pseudouridine synthase [Rickettsiales bacterium]|nr:MAG: RluA family pseudouridine synthase [Rickettsiales bacterium]